MISLRAMAMALGGDVSGNSVLAPGPGHSPRDRSLSVTPSATTPNGFLVNSFAGDDTIACLDHVRAKLGLPEFSQRRPQKPGAATSNGDARERNGQAAPYDPKAAFEFIYRDESGSVIYRVKRIDHTGKLGKNFFQNPPDPNRPDRWLTGSGCMDGVRRVPYRLPELIEALGNGALVVIAEGERKVDLLRSWNIPATCNSGGHGSVRSWAAHARDYFKPGDNVVILPDNDKAGQDHASAVAAFLNEAGATVRWLDLPGLPPKGDIIDWAEAGAGVGQLHDLIEHDARTWKPGERESVNAPPAPKAETFLVKASEIAPEPISWLWKYWLARGKLHIIAGAPGTGKTTIYLAFAAIITSGGTWPDRTRATVGNVIIWTSEDGHADTIIPRLMRMGADLDRIFIVRAHRDAKGKQRPFNPATDMDSLRAKAATIPGGVDFVFLDPVVSAVPTTRNSDKNAEARAGLAPFVEFVEALNAAGGGVTHVSKGTSGKDPLERVTGTLAYGAVPRIVLLAAENKATGDNEPERIMVRAKNNIGPKDGGFGYHIDTATLHEKPDIEATRIVWELPLEGSALELLNDAEGETGKLSKLDEAKRFLRAALAKGERPQDEIKDAAAAENISWGTLKRASEDGGISKRKDGFGAGARWVWRLL